MLVSFFFFPELFQSPGYSVDKSEELFCKALKSSKLDIFPFLLLIMFLSAVCLGVCMFVFLHLTHGSPLVIEDVICVCILNSPLTLFYQMHFCQEMEQERAIDGYHVWLWTDPQLSWWYREEKRETEILDHHFEMYLGLTSSSLKRRSL